MARFRRLGRDYKRFQQTLVGLHFITFPILMVITLLPSWSKVHDRFKKKETQAAIAALSIVVGQLYNASLEATTYD